MDNIFEYLIYGFIIISAISSFFKKKKPLPKEPSNQTPHQRTDITENKITDIPPSQKPKAEEYDILKEIEGFFNVGQPKQPEVKVHSDKEMYEGAKNRESYMPVPEKSFHKSTESEHTFYDPRDKISSQDDKRSDYRSVPEKSFHTTTSSEHSFTDPWDLKRKNLEKKKEKLSPKIEQQASAYEESLRKKESAATGIIRDINQRLKNPATLKEYVIISEIIGKPKALK